MNAAAIIMLTGVSLSFCIKDLCEGKVTLEQVIRIIASTCYATPEEFEQVIADYQRTYWRRYPEQAAQFARALNAAGKIDQPRLRDEEWRHPGFNHDCATNGAPTQNWFVGEPVIAEAELDVVC